MSFPYFRAIAAAAAVGTVISVGPSMIADPSYLALASSRPGQLSVVELDLGGVRADAVTDLPSPEAVPLQDGSAAPTQPGTTPLASARTLAPSAPHPDVLTPKLATKPFTVLGVTWDLSDGLGDVVIRYRTHESGTWSPWSGVTASDVAPDPGTADAKAGSRGGTDPIVAVDADGLQIWAEATSGTVSGIKAVLIDPGADPVGLNAASFQSAVTAPAQPAIISRAAWGANESLRNCSPDYSNSMVAAAVHHTASTNAYAAGAVAGIVRGIYAFHTRAVAAGGRGWCDIGYNFLVDRFGRTYEGRAGGITSTVVGAHTGGFNSRTIGVSAIGDFGAGAAPAPMVESISRLIAWKFSVHHIVAGNSVRLVSAGGESKYPAGTAVTFPTIYGHRDAGLTSCPGQNLYNLLPAIRSRVASLANASVAASPFGTVDTYTGASSGVGVRGWALDPESTASLTIQVSVDGAVRTLTANASRPDVGSIYGKGNNHGFSGVLTAGNGRHVVCLTAVNVGGGRNTVLGCQWVTVQNANPVGSLDRVSTTPTSVTVAGWALDPDTTAPITAHVYLDGKAAQALTANIPRPDIGRIYGRGENHGFAGTVPTTQGTHRLCLYLINTPLGANPQLPCRTITTGNSPIGVLDRVTTTPTSVTVAGWALDPDTTAPITVHVYLDGKAAQALTANTSRPDIGRIYGRGENHGFTGTVPTTQGTHRLCLYLINTPLGANPQLPCRTVTSG
jgi:N-acetylmuramoyl-L-alanine amidase